LFTKTYRRILTPALTAISHTFQKTLHANRRSLPSGDSSTTLSTGTSRPGWSPHDRQNLI
jgi:hypothetical protein